MRKEEVLIVGFGDTGLSVARHLKAHGIPFAACDSCDPFPYPQFASEFGDARAYAGALDPELLCNAEKIVLSPGVPRTEPAVRAAIEKGVPVVGDVELFAQYGKSGDLATEQIVGVTGSNGKSTVCRLLADMVLAAGRRMALGGNYGRPVLDLLNEKKSPEVYVLELSSFQLETTYSLSGHIGVLLNVSADHMDRYDSYDDYRQAKLRVFNSCRIAVFNRADRIKPAFSERIISFGEDEPQAGHFGLREFDGELYVAFGEDAWLAVRELPIAGTIGRLNVMAACAAGVALGLPKDAMLKAVRLFSCLPHRFESVGGNRTVQWIDDSKATNVGAAISALETVGSRCLWIGGGSDKASDFKPLAEVLKRCARRVILYGEAAEKIETAVDSIKDTTPIVKVKTLDEAVSDAATNSVDGDTVLLSPACASFDQYENYRQRGEHFAQLVRALP